MSAALDDVARVVCNSRGLAFGEKIGEGAFKKTYLVWTLEGEPWALKVVREECSVERTAREVDAMKKCSHPSIARLLDVSSVLCDGREYTFMLEEYMAGGTLAERIQDSLLSPDEAWAIGLQLIGAIEHIASRELVHRDLKPANIMFRRVWSDPVVVDFGLVRDLSKESVTHTWLTRGPGTPYFAGPEQLNNDKGLIDWRADQFALGVVISVCTLGMHPYECAGDSDADVVNRVATRERPGAAFLTQSRAIGLPVLAQMVGVWPAERYRTPAMLMEAWRDQR